MLNSIELWKHNSCNSI